MWILIFVFSFLGLFAMGYPCSVCGKVLSRSDGLSRHMGVHSGKRFSCTLCGLAFSDDCNLRRHVRVKHRGMPVVGHVAPQATAGPPAEPESLPSGGGPETARGASPARVEVASPFPQLGFVLGDDSVDGGSSGVVSGGDSGVVHDAGDDAMAMLDDFDVDNALDELFAMVDAGQGVPVDDTSEVSPGPPVASYTIVTPGAMPVWQPAADVSGPISGEGHPDSAFSAHLTDMRAFFATVCVNASGPRTNWVCPHAYCVERDGFMSLPEFLAHLVVCHLDSATAMQGV